MFEIVCVLLPLWLQSTYNRTLSRNNFMDLWLNYLESWKKSHEIWFCLRCADLISSCCKSLIHLKLKTFGQSIILGPCKSSLAEVLPLYLNFSILISMFRHILDSNVLQCTPPYLLQDHDLNSSFFFIQNKWFYENKKRNKTGTWVI